MFKYIFLNISKTKKLYIPFFIIFILIFFTLMCSFSIRNNVMVVGKNQLGKYVAIAITTKNGYFSDADNLPVRTIINEKFINDYITHEYTVDYYAFNQRMAGSDTLNPLSYNPTNLMVWFYPDERMPFTFMAYSDIEKSTHFRLGDKSIIEGRFAESTSECNISSELAELNNLFVGDNIEIFLFSADPQYFSFEIVGIYEDKTEEISNELVLLESRTTPTGNVSEVEIEGQERVLSTELEISAASRDNISRNQIITVAPTSNDLTKFSAMNLDLGYDVVVYYTHDEKSIFAYNDEIKEILPEQFEIFDSADVLRHVTQVLEKTENSLSWFLSVLCFIGVVFGVLIIFYILKDRTYDIGVFRTKGMSRIKTSVLFSGEIFFVLLTSLIIAWLLYITSFTHILKPFFNIQGNLFANEGDNVWNYFNIMNAVREYEISLFASPHEIIISFLVILSFSAIVGLAAVLFISRHEPMKTMTEH